MIQIKAEKTKYHRFTMYFDYDVEVLDLCRALKESYGWQRFSFNAEGDLKRWVFSEVIFIKLIMDRFNDTKGVVVDSNVQHIYRSEMPVITMAQESHKATVEIKEKKDTDFVVGGIKGDLYPYQKVGVEFLLAANGRAIVADPPGMGKSLQALGFATHKKFGRTLVVCPASVKSSWEKEIKKWTSLKYVVIDSKTDISRIPADKQVWVINYDILRKHFEQLMKTRFDLCVADECHYVKSPTATRTKVLRQLTKTIPHVVLLSGTPLLSRPVEMFTLLNMIDPMTWNNYYTYTRQYCGGRQGRWGWDASGATNTEELHDKIKKYFIRRKKEEVLSQLPPKNRIDVPVTFPDDIASEYELAENNLIAYLREYAGKQPAEIARAVQAEKLAQLNVLRQLCAFGKLSAAEEIIESVLEADEKILVFSSFVEPLQILKDKLKDKAVMITGKTNVDERGAIVERFQTDPEVKVFLGGVKSAGVGITLTAAQNVLFLDYAWNPADMQQAEDRVHRPGQEAASVNIYQLHVEGTIDGKLKGILEKKQKIFDSVVEGIVPDESNDTMKAVVDDMMERRGAKWAPMDLSK